METFTDRSIRGIKAIGSILCVGLDPQARHMPPHLVTQIKQECRPDASYEEVMARVFLAFNKAIIDAVKQWAVWVKPQSAFYEVLGHWGIWALQETIRYAREQDLIVILDAKRGDGGDTAQAYAETYLGEIDSWANEDGTVEKHCSPLRVDALTVHGYIGEECIKHFVKQIVEHGTCAFVVTKTSFVPTSAVEEQLTITVDEFVQAFKSAVEAFLKVDGASWELAITTLLTQQQRPLWQQLALLVNRWGAETAGEAGWRNLGVVSGATFKEETEAMVKITGKTWKLVPGFGSQGAGADKAVVGADQDGFGITVNSSRDIHNAWRNEKDKRFNGPSEMFAICAARAAEDARNQLNAALLRAGKGRAFLKAA